MCADAVAADHKGLPRRLDDLGKHLPRQYVPASRLLSLLASLIMLYSQRHQEEAGGRAESLRRRQWTVTRGLGGDFLYISFFHCCFTCFFVCGFLL